MLKKLLIIDDHSLFRDGLELLLSLVDPSFQVAKVQDVEQGLALIRAGNHFDLVILDWHLPGVEGVEALAAIRAEQPKDRVVVLSGESNPEIIRLCIENGAAGFIPKDSTRAQLLLALQTISADGVYLPDALAPEGVVGFDPVDEASNLTQPVGLHLESCYPQLSERQCAVLRGMACGQCNKTIARSLNISEETVKYHMTVAYRILGVSKRTEALYLLSQRKIRIV